MLKVMWFWVLLIIFSPSFNAQTKKIVDKTNLQIAVTKIRDSYFKHDFEGGSELGKKLIEKYPNSLELKTWYVKNLARSNVSDSSVDYAEKLVKEYGENFWTLLALTSAQNQQKPEMSIATAEKLVKLFPNEEEAIFAYGSALFQNDKEKEAIEWLNKNKIKIKDQSRFLTNLATNVYYVEEKLEKGDINKALRLFAQAVKLNPLSVNANYQYGVYLVLAKRNDEAIPFLQKTIQLSPNVSAMRSYLWQRIELQTKKTEDQKKVELTKAINQYLTQTKNSPDALLATWNKYRDLAGWKEEAKLEDVKKRDYFEKVILEKYPNTKYDETIAFIQLQTLYGKYFGKEENSKNLENRLKKKSKRTTEETKLFEKYLEKIKLLETEETILRRNYLKRPKHFDRFKLGRIYIDLFYQLASKKDSTDEEIRALLKGTIENNKNYYDNLNSYIAGVLLNRQTEQPDSEISKDAEKYARLGIIEAENKIKDLPKDAKPDKIIELQLQPINVLADVLTTNEKLEEAEKLLLKASQMKSTTGGNYVLERATTSTEQVWAKFFTAKKEWEKAETFYLKTASEDEDVVKTTFEKFFEKKTGKKDGFADYFAEIEQKLKVVAKNKVLQSRIKDPKEMIPFSLKSIEDKTISSTELKGKVIVINIWGVWCGPCVAEMPELQKVYDKYKNDKDVAILTIDSGDELAKVKKFIEEKKYTLPVLMEDGYVKKLPQFLDGSAFPTTLFIDKNGNVSFVVVGASSDLMEHFVWRIDLMKEEKVK